MKHLYQKLNEILRFSVHFFQRVFLNVFIELFLCDGIQSMFMCVAILTSSLLVYVFLFRCYFDIAAITYTQHKHILLG